MWLPELPVLEKVVRAIEDVHVAWLEETGAITAVPKQRSAANTA